MALLTICFIAVTGVVIVTGAIIAWHLKRMPIDCALILMAYIALAAFLYLSPWGFKLFAEIG
jgi:hypothetical protein